MQESEMESQSQTNNKKRKQVLGQEQPEDLSMEADSSTIEQRKIMKVKKRGNADRLPEDGEEDGVVYSEDEFEEEIIHKRGKHSDDEGWEDLNSEEEEEEEMEGEEQDEVMEDIGAAAGS